MMKLLLISCLLGSTLAVPAVFNGAYDYFEKVGIPLADNIRAAEEAGFGGSRIAGGSKAALGASRIAGGSKAALGASRIAGGSEAALGQLPYVGGLLITLTTGFTAACGSTLLTDTKLVTAAHCWYDGRNLARSIEVVLGSLTLFEGGTRIVTSQVQPHEYYDASSVTHDIAIVTIEAVAFNGTSIAAIALPTGALLNQDFVGTLATTAGWGLQSDTAVIGTNQTLHYVQLQVTTLSLCQSLYGSNKVTADNMCVSGSGGRSICSGDTGGPLVARSGGRDVLIGIGSFTHFDGCTIGYPTVFTRVNSYVSWILNKIYS